MYMEKKNKIPVNVYTDAKSMNTNNVKNALSFSGIKSLKNGTYVPNTDYRDTDIASLIGLYHKKYDDLNRDELKVRNEIIKNPDFHGSIRSDLDTLNSNGGIASLNNLGRILKKEKLSTYKELISKLSERFKQEDIERQKEQRIKHAKNRYKKDKFMFDHILNVLNDEEEFKPEYLEVSDPDMLPAKISNMINILEKLEMIPEKIYTIWYDEYGMSEDGYRKFFNLEL